jgi:DNA-binding GntR family transcriptional regulator
MSTGDAVEAATRTLREALASGELRPGDAVSAAAFATRHRSTPGVVREALRILAGEGLVEPGAHGARVVPVTAGEDRDLAEVLGTVEVRAAARAAAVASPAARRTLRTLLREHERLLSVAADEERARQAAAFHRAVVEASGSVLLRSLFERLVLRRAALGIPRAAGDRACWHAHAAVLEAIVAGDADTAAHRMGDHVRGG